MGAQAAGSSVEGGAGKRLPMSLPSPRTERLGYDDYMQSVRSEHAWRAQGDVLRLCIHGFIEEADFQSFVHAFETVVAQHGHCLVITDVRGMTGISPAARQRFEKWDAQGRCRGRVILGAPRAARALISVILLGAKMLTGRSEPTAFLYTEEAAQAWLVERRAQLGLPASSVQPQL